MFIGIIRRIHLQMLEQDAPQREITHGKLHGRIGLQRNPGTQAIDIKSCYDRILIRHGGLLFYNRSQDRYLNRRKAGIPSFFQAFGIPKRIILPLHPAHKPTSRQVPINLVRIRKKKRQYCLLRESQRITISGIIQQIQQIRFREHQLPVDPLRQFLLQSYIIKGNLRSDLMTTAQIIQQREIAHTRMDSVSTGTHILRVFQTGAQPLKANQPSTIRRIFQLLTKRLEIPCLIYIYIKSILRPEIRGPRDAIRTKASYDHQHKKDDRHPKRNHS